jgi:hypothetical protein
MKERHPTVLSIHNPLSFLELAQAQLLEVPTPDRHSGTPQLRLCERYSLGITFVAALRMDPQDVDTLVEER